MHVLKSEIIKVLRAKGEPLKAKDIAKLIKRDRSDVNQVLYEHMGDDFTKHEPNSTWTIVKAGDILPAKGPDVVSASSAEVKAFFSPGSPGDGPLEQICRYIRDAKKSVFVQAYYIHGEEVVDALIAVKNNKSHPCDVQVIMSATCHCGTTRNYGKRHGGKPSKETERLHGAGIKVWEYAPNDNKNNHNKCVIIDKEITITGGLNFSVKAQENSDNIVVIRSAKVAEMFFSDWECNKVRSEPFPHDGRLT